MGSNSGCGWCEDPKRKLKHYLLHDGSRKGFCSEDCMKEFRETYGKSLCCNCERIIQGSPVKIEEKTSNLGITESREFCCTECLQKYRIREVQKQNERLDPKTAAASLKTPLVTSSLKQTISSPPKPMNTSTTLEKPEVESPASTDKTKLLKQAKSGHSKHQYEIWGYWDWEQYLKEEGGVVAPNECFKQHPLPPTNEFELKEKIEALDPRNPSSTCIATVVGKMGPRLQLRLDGSDSSNDFWELVDSGGIQPIGTCEKNGGMLQPPLGFQKNPSQWPIFVLQTLSGATIASPSVFKPEPPSPSSNMFEVGMKLEAVDRKNPRLICPATIGDVKDDQVFVTFDGWKGAFDYWCRYDCRDIFPVGWCQKSRHPLQPPGSKGTNSKSKERLDKMILPTDNPLLIQTLPKTANGASGAVKKAAATPESSTAARAISKTTSSGVVKPAMEEHSESSVNTAPDDKKPANGLLDKQGNSPVKKPPMEGADSTFSVESATHDMKKAAIVTLYINHGCSCGPNIDAKLLGRQPKSFGPGLLNKTMKDVVQAVIDCSSDVKAVYNVLKGGNGHMTVTAEVDNKTWSLKLPHVNRVGAFWSYFRKLTQDLKCCPNLLSDAIVDACPLCSISNATGNKTTPSQPPSQGTARKRMNSVDTTSQLSQPPAKTPRLAASAVINSNVDLKRKCFSDETTDVVAPLKSASTSNPKPCDGNDLDSRAKTSKACKSMLVATNAHISAATPVGAGLGNLNGALYEVHTSANPLEWSIEDVIKYLTSIDHSLRIHAETFRKHEIDGKAFLLLNSDMMMKYMGLKLGPALKICNTIERLKGMKKAQLA